MFTCRFVEPYACCCHEYLYVPLTSATALASYLDSTSLTIFSGLFRTFPVPQLPSLLPKTGWLNIGTPYTVHKREYRIKTFQGWINQWIIIESPSLLSFPWIERIFMCALLVNDSVSHHLYPAQETLLYHPQRLPEHWAKLTAQPLVFFTSGVSTTFRGTNQKHNALPKYVEIKNLLHRRISTLSSGILCWHHYPSCLSC